MKTTTLVLLLVLCLFTLSCEKEEQMSFDFDAIVMNELDCGSTFLIEIQNDSDEIMVVTGREDKIYYADGLSDELKREDLQIQLNIRNPNSDEGMVCHPLGFAYPHIIVLKASKKEQ